MSNASRFEFFKSHHVPTLTVLKAAIEDFSYDPHAHEEYAFGVTLAGRQDFFSGGQFHRSPPGNVILFNPEEVHDGHSGGAQALDYLRWSGRWGCPPWRRAPPAAMWSSVTWWVSALKAHE